MKIISLGITALFLILVVTVLFLFIPTTATNAYTSGIHLRSATWSGTITITEDTRFAPWTILTILPGTTIFFEKKQDIPGTAWTKWADAYIKDHDDPTGKEGYELSHYDLSARIIAKGTEQEPIRFTSAQPQPEYADWDQLVLFDNSVLKHVIVSYAHNGINLNGNKIIIRNSKVHDSLWSCIDIFGVDNVVENTEAYHCWHQAIGVKIQGPNIIRNSTLHDSQLAINCENGGVPIISSIRTKAALITPECSAKTMEIHETEGHADTTGGTYNGKLIYPASS